jgi:hypothetical protein
MEKRNLPNGTAVLVLGILSILTCCCSWGVGMVLGIVAIVLANKDLKLYSENPELYLNYKNLNTGKILAIIGLVLSSLTLIANIYFRTVVGEQGIKEMMENLQEKIKYEQEN